MVVEPLRYVVNIIEHEENFRNYKVAAYNGKSKLISANRLGLSQSVFVTIHSYLSTHRITSQQIKLDQISLFFFFLPALHAFRHVRFNFKSM